MTDNKTSPPLTPHKALLKMMTGLLLSTILIGFLLFLGAGRMDWKLGWLFILFWCLTKAVFVSFYDGTTRNSWLSA